MILTELGLIQEEQYPELCSTWWIIFSHGTAKRDELIHAVTSVFPSVAPFCHTAKQVNTVSRQLNSENTINGVLSSQSQNNLHLFWNTVMNHFNLSFLEVLFYSFYKFHPSWAAQLHLKTPQMKVLVICFLVSNCTHFQPEDS